MKSITLSCTPNTCGWDVTLPNSTKGRFCLYETEKIFGVEEDEPFKLVLKPITRANKNCLTLVHAMGVWWWEIGDRADVFLGRDIDDALDALLGETSGKKFYFSFLVK